MRKQSAVPEELDVLPRGSVGGAETVGPADGAGLSNQAGVGALLGDRRSGGSGVLPETLVLLGDA